MKLILFLLLFLVQCFPQIKVSEPSKEFAHFDKIDTYYKSISSDDVRITIYPVHSGSKENTSSSLWMNEIILVLKSKGYNYIATETKKTKKGESYSYSEFETFHNGSPFIYAVGVLPWKRENFISEVSGKKKNYYKKKNEIQKILGSVEPTFYYQFLSLFSN